MGILPPMERRSRTVSSAAIISLVVLVFLWTLGPRSYHDLQPSLVADDAGTVGSEKATQKMPVETSDRVAVIIEQRSLPNLAPLVLHFASVLGPDWPVVIYTSAEFPMSPPVVRAMKEGSLTIRSLPDDAKFDNHTAVSKFLTSPWIWNSLAPAEHVLLFQADSIICSKSQYTADDFLEYDFIGAPIAPRYGAGYNGGLSLRSRELMLRLSQEREASGGNAGKFEDQWYYKKLRALAAAGENVTLPSPEAAIQFSVETLWGAKPFGYHQISRWHASRMKEVLEWCPEVGMMVGGGLHPGHS